MSFFSFLCSWQAMKFLKSENAYETLTEFIVCEKEENSEAEFSVEEAKRSYHAMGILTQNLPQDAGPQGQFGAAAARQQENAMLNPTKVGLLAKKLFRVSLIDLD
jgi:hypothetical protein